MCDLLLLWALCSSELWVSALCLPRLVTQAFSPQCLSLAVLIQVKVNALPITNMDHRATEHSTPNSLGDISWIQKPLCSCTEGVRQGMCEHCIDVGSIVGVAMLCRVKHCWKMFSWWFCCAMRGGEFSKVGTFRQQNKAFCQGYNIIISCSRLQ